MMAPKNIVYAGEVSEVASLLAINIEAKHTEGCRKCKFLCPIIPTICCHSNNMLDDGNRIIIPQGNFKIFILLDSP